MSSDDKIREIAELYYNNRYSLSQLKIELSKRKLSKTGNKSILIYNLIKDDLLNDLWKIKKVTDMYTYFKFRDSNNNRIYIYKTEYGYDALRTSPYVNGKIFYATNDQRGDTLCAKVAKKEDVLEWKKNVKERIAGLF